MLFDLRIAFNVYVKRAMVIKWGMAPQRSLNMLVSRKILMIAVMIPVIAIIAKTLFLKIDVLFRKSAIPRKNAAMQTTIPQSRVVKLKVLEYQTMPIS